MEIPSKERNSDLGNARRFVRRFSDHVRFVTTRKTWLVWDGRRWRPDTTDEVQRLARETVQAMYGEAGALDDDARPQLAKWAVQSEGRPRLTAILALACSELPIAIAQEALDADPWLLNCRNGTLDLRTGILRPHRREDLLTKLCPVDYDPDAACPQWLAFLTRILNGDEELIGFLQRFCGYVLTGVVREHVLVFAYGRGRNGKSTLWETMLDLLGDYALKAGTETIMLRGRDGPGRASPERVQLLGKRLVVMSEVDAGHRLNEAQVKDLTGGDRVSGRDVYEKLIVFAPTHKLVLYGNHKPVIHGTDDAIWERLCLVPFAVKIPEDERVPDFRERVLWPELPGILTWAVQGCLAWQLQGLQPPLAVTEARNDYRLDMDHVLQFLVERCERRDGATTPVQMLYTAYGTWCEASGVEKLTMRAFSTNMSARGYTKSKRSSMVWHDLQMC